MASKKVLVDKVTDVNLQRHRGIDVVQVQSDGSVLCGVCQLQFDDLRTIQYHVRTASHARSFDEAHPLGVIKGQDVPPASWGSQHLPGRNADVSSEGAAAKGEECKEQTKSWMTEIEWARAHRVIRPTSSTLEDLKRYCCTGQLHLQFTSSQLTKLMREVRDIMKERGWLREAGLMPSGSAAKEVMNKLIADAVNCVARKPATAATDEEVAAAAATAAMGSTIVGPTEESDEGPVDIGALRTGPVAPLRSGAKKLSISAMSTLQQSVEAAGVPSVGAGHKMSSIPGPSRPTALANALAQQQLAQSHEAQSSSPCPSVLTTLLPTSPPGNAGYELYSSPLSRVVVIIKRFQLRMGSFPVRFDIPQQYLADVSSRRLRVQIVPMTGTIPSSWPKVKEVFVFVNEKNVQTSWKRSWPARKVEVTKSYLPLDITQFLTTLHATHKLQLDCFNQDFCGSFAIVLVHTKSEHDIVKDYRSKLLKTKCQLQDFYRQILNELDVHGDGEVVFDVPSVSVKCPISQSRIQVPVRGKLCKHLQCVDFSSFLRSCHIGCFWNCPLCDAPMRLTDVIVDEPFQKMLESSASQSWTHAQLLKVSQDNKDGDVEFDWGESEKHKKDAMDISSDDDDDRRGGRVRRHHTNAAVVDFKGKGEPPKSKRRIENDIEGIGSAEEPICL